MTERKKQPSIHPLRMPSSLKPSAMRTADFFAERSSQADIDAARRLLRRTGGQPPDSSDQLDDPGPARQSQGASHNT